MDTAPCTFPSIMTIQIVFYKNIIRFLQSSFTLLLYYFAFIILFLSLAKLLHVLFTLFQLYVTTASFTRKTTARQALQLYVSISTRLQEEFFFFFFTIIRIQGHHHSVKTLNADVEFPIKTNKQTSFSLSLSILKQNL